MIPAPTTPTAPAAADLDLQIQHLLVAVEAELRRRPQGFSELALIRQLQQPPWQLLEPVSFRDPAKLYPVHFLLFHVLYRLRDQLADQGGIVEVSPLNIRLHHSPVVAGDGTLAAADPLRAFYLDLDRLALPEATILAMMADFRAGRSGRTPDAQETLAAAQVLGLAGAPRDLTEAKYCFRRAVMQAHPDRGGDTARLQELNRAFAILKQHFR